jgi:uncharacterized cupin superfamily protein
MKKVNINEIKEEPWQSPKGKYAVSFTGISEALKHGRARELGHRVAGDAEERHPFDLELNRMPPGKPNFPFHAHSAQWEMYLIVSGKGSVRDKDGKSEVVAGDAFIFGPNEPHQITNSGDVDLVYYVIADNPIGESGYYPDSKKWKLNKTSQADRVVIKGPETDYFDGEE